MAMQQSYSATNDILYTYYLLILFKTGPFGEVYSFILSFLFLCKMKQNNFTIRERKIFFFLISIYILYSLVSKCIYHILGMFSYLENDCFVV